VHDGEQIFALQSGDDLAGVGRAGDGVGAENKQGLDRRILHFAQQGGAQAIHIHAPSGSWALSSMPNRRCIPLQVATGGIRQPAATQPILCRERRQRADGAHVLPAVEVAVDAVGNLDQRRALTGIELGQAQQVILG
jgi:hypothetical protein